MSSAFLITFGNMLMIICLILIGYIIKKSGLIVEHLDTVLSKLIVYLFLPALNLYTFTTKCTPENFEKYAPMILFGAGFYIIEVIAATVIARYLPTNSEYMRSIYEYCLAIANTGAIGTPLVMALFDENGLFIYYLFQLPATVITYAWAVPRMMPSKDGASSRLISNLRNIINPPMIGIAIGMVLGLTGINRLLPSLVLTTVQKISGCYTQCALLMVGYIIGSYQIRKIIHPKIDIIIGSLRLIIIPGIFLIFLKCFHASSLLTAMTILSLGCPVGMNCVVYPAAYGEDSTIGAGLIMTSYLAAIITVPVLYALI